MCVFVCQGLHTDQIPLVYIRFFICYLGQQRLLEMSGYGAMMESVTDTNTDENTLGHKASFSVYKESYLRPEDLH